MIPITANQVFEHEDKESGVVYQFRYLTESARMGEYRRIAKMETTEREICKTDAPALIDQNLEGEEKEKALNSKTVELMQKRRDDNPIGCYELYDAYIDLFLCGWKGKNLPAFPEDGHPSKMFRFLDKVKMYWTIQDNISELIALNIDEIKN